MKVNNKVIVVTGAGNGMGREIVLHLLSKEAIVVAIDINEKALEETVLLAKDKKAFLSTYVLDITKKEEVEAIVQKIINQEGSIDGLINNAGIIQPFIKVRDLTYEKIDQVMAVNFYGTLYLTKAFLPHLISRPEAHIVNISSMGGFLPVPGQAIYGAAKAAVKLMTEALYSELADTNVRTTVVFPGAIKTDIKLNSGLEVSKKVSEKDAKMAAKITTPDKAAQIIIEGMEKNSFRVLIGKDAKFLDFFYRINPRKAAQMIFNKMKDKLSV